jgi:hypothetical protein
MKAMAVDTFERPTVIRIGTDDEDIHRGGAYTRQAARESGVNSGA